MAKLFHGDCKEVMQGLQPESVDLAFWSPPYHVGKGYEAGMSFSDWRELLGSAVTGCARLLKPGGFLVVNIADILCFQDDTMPKIQAMNIGRQIGITKSAILATLAEHPEYNRYQLAAALGCSEQTIDRRLNGNNVRGGKSNNQTRVYLVGGLIETIGAEAGLFLYDRRIWAKDPCWANSQWHSLSYRAVDEFEYLFIFWKPGVTVVNRSRLHSKEWGAWGSRGIWNIPSVRSNDEHEAMFPLELAERVVRLYSEAGETVLDCFMGLGTTGEACRKHGREFIGIEKERQYFLKAKTRLTTACTGLAGFSASPSESTLEGFTGQVGLSQPTANQ